MRYNCLFNKDGNVFLVVIFGMEFVNIKVFVEISLWWRGIGWLINLKFLIIFILSGVL